MLGVNIPVKFRATEMEKKVNLVRADVQRLAQFDDVVLGSLEAALPHTVGSIHEKQDVHGCRALHHFPWKNTQKDRFYIWSKDLLCPIILLLDFLVSGRFNLFTDKWSTTRVV